MSDKSKAMSTNDLLLRTLQGSPVERPPVWMMRQAGRILPEYREIRASLRDFKELVETPDLAAEVTIQPVDILGVDAAIIFSDILVIPEAMGLPYQMEEKTGPVFPRVLKAEADIDALITGPDAADRLDYVYEAIRITTSRLQGRVPLIGFCGAPWTILAYMTEGRGSKTFSIAKKLLYTEPALAHRLLDKITEASIVYLQRQVDAGAAVIQIFDSWAGLLSPEQYETFALPYITRMTASLQGTPVIVFAKGAWFALGAIGRTSTAGIGLDWHTDPAFARKEAGPNKILQGNLDPCALYASPEEVSKGTLDMIRAFGRQHIVNLGHGVYPDTPLEGVRAMIDTVKSFRYD